LDFEATAKDGEVGLDANWQVGDRRQMEIYQWPFSKNGFKVSDTGYFVYCNGMTDKEAFDGKLEFDVKIIPYKGDTSWVEGAPGSYLVFLIEYALGWEPSLLRLRAGKSCKASCNLH